MQPQPDGTGGAVRAALDAGRATPTPCSCSTATTRWSPPELISELVEAHREAGAAATVMTIELDDPE